MFWALWRRAPVTGVLLIHFGGCCISYNRVSKRISWNIPVSQRICHPISLKRENTTRETPRLSEKCTFEKTLYTVNVKKEAYFLQLNRVLCRLLSGNQLPGTVAIGTFASLAVCTARLREAACAVSNLSFKQKLPHYFFPYCRPEPGDGHVAHHFL